MQLLQFGCYDEVLREAGGRTVRRCNWVRFLRAAGLSTANLRAALGADGRAQFEVLRPIAPRSPLLATFPDVGTEPSIAAAQCSDLVAAALQGELLQSRWNTMKLSSFIKSRRSAFSVTFCCL